MSAPEVIHGPASDGRYMFWCPGCEEAHWFAVSGQQAWNWNGDKIRPTVSPSILVRSGHYADVTREACWCTYNPQEHLDAPSKFICQLCHSFVREGNIEFLSDCTHGLAGQTVALPVWESA